jgi:hypothetical protein
LVAASVSGGLLSVRGFIASLAEEPISLFIRNMGWCDAVIVVLTILIVVVLAGAAWCPWVRTALGAPGGWAGAGRAGRKEGYGPPPGVYRALSHEELDGRGWPEFPYEYTANTASSISHMIERSA